MKTFFALSMMSLLLIQNSFASQVNWDKRIAEAMPSSLAGHVVGIAVGLHVANISAGAIASAAFVGVVMTSQAISEQALNKEVIAKAVLNDCQEYYANGTLSLALENSIIGIQELDDSISVQESVDMIVEAFI